MNKKEFRKLIADNFNQLGNTIIIGNVIVNKCVIYNPKVNNNLGFSYLSIEKNVNYLWRIAKKVGKVQYNGIELVVY